MIALDQDGTGSFVAFGGVTKVFNKRSDETDLVCRDVPKGFWDKAGSRLWASIMLKTPTGGGGKRLRAYVNDMMHYDSGVFCSSAGTSFFSEFELIRVDDATLAASCRLLGDVPRDALASTHTDVSVDFSDVITLRLTAQARSSDAMCYCHGWSMYFPPPQYLL